MEVVKLKESVIVRSNLPDGARGFLWWLMGGGR